ncbi:MAG TPA: hypothetical protein VJW51_08990, partial [Candidatus Acidoferrales bacterium]|nr:hypothetical protein [Candidatus Acidoferrales bacterium]
MAEIALAVELRPDASCLDSPALSRIGRCSRMSRASPAGAGWKDGRACSNRTEPEIETMKRESIGLTLASSFAFLVCALLGMGGLGLNRMGRINADLEELVTKRWAKAQLCRAALGYSNLNN